MSSGNIQTQTHDFNIVKQLCYRRTGIIAHNWHIANDHLPLETHRNEAKTKMYTWVNCALIQ